MVTEVVNEGHVNRTRTIFLFLGALLLFPAIAYADAGTPLMWAGMLHLVFGNALIGIGEGLLIAKLYNVRKKVMVWIMVGANYFSMFFGHFLIVWLSPKFEWVSLYEGWRFIWLGLLVLFILTVFLEWPFVLLGLRKQKDRFKRSFQASALVQVLSYAIIVPWYILTSGASLYTGTRLDPSLSFVTNKNAVIYFISTTDGNVYRRRIVDSKHQKVFDLSSLGEFDRLFVSQSEKAGFWDLYAVIAAMPPKDAQKVLLMKEFETAAAPIPNETIDPRGVHDTWLNIWAATDLRCHEERDWVFNVGFWPVEGLRIRNSESGKTVRVALETPFLQWYVRNATVLPGDEVIFQLGDQICVFDRNSRKLGLITWGRGPVVVLKSPQATEIRPDKLSK